MNKCRFKFVLVCLSLMIIFSLVSCTMIELDVTNEINLPTVTSQPTESLTLQETAARVVNALGEKDLEVLTQYIHPEKGVRFSPYGYVREEHQVFMPEVLSSLAESDKTYIWGRYDGSGEPIELTFDEYYDEFVYSADFANAEVIAVNERIGQGNTINNILEFYPGGSFVEHHFSGFEEQYGGIDWQSLRLVFTQEDGAWYLVGIVHDEWTI